MKKNRIPLFENFNSQLIELKNKLSKYQIDTDKWGKGEAKTLQHLLDEIESKDCTIQEKNNSILRCVDFVGVDIFYKNLKLKEDKQVFNDGRERRRKMMSSVAEKMKIGEDPLESAIRGIKEELGFDVEVSQIKKLKTMQYKNDSMSYPGLITEYNGHRFTLTLNDSQYKDNYVDKQSDKSTYFIWEKI